MGEFHYQLPVYFLVGRIVTEVDNTTYEGFATLTDQNAPTALVMFTDEPGAEQFRDKYYPKHVLVEVKQVDEMLAFLRFGKSSASHVALDPFRLGMQTQIASIDDILQNPPS